MHLLAVTYIQQNDEVSISIYANIICLAHLLIEWVNIGLVLIIPVRLFWIIFLDFNRKTTHFFPVYFISYMWIAGRLQEHRIL